MTSRSKSRARLAAMKKWAAAQKQRFNRTFSNEELAIFSTGFNMGFNYSKRKYKPEAKI